MPSRSLCCPKGGPARARPPISIPLLPQGESVRDDRDPVRSQARLVSEFLQCLCVVDGGDELDLCVGRRDPDGGAHTIVARFHPGSVSELRLHIRELRKGNPYTRPLVLDESRVQDTYEFLRFVLRAHEQAPSLITISTSLRNVAMFALDNIDEDAQELSEPEYVPRKRSRV